MPDLEINVKVVGADQGANDLKQLGDAASQAGDDAKTAGSGFQSVGSSLKDFKSNLAGVVGSFTALSTSVLDIVRSWENLEQAQIRLDTANKRVQQSAVAVETAQTRYNQAVAKYGENSAQAQVAAQKLEVAVKNHEIATERADLQQGKFNTTLAEFATNVAPDVIGVFGSIVGIIGNFTQRGEGGVTLLGKLKQSFIDLVSSGGNVENAVSNASNALSGLGSRAGTAGTAASTLRNEVVQLGSGIASSVPAMTNFGGGLTNTAAAAERSAGPLGNIERSLATVAPAAAGAAGPLASFGGSLGEAGAASVEAAGSLEAAAASTGALETSATAAAAESVGLAAGITSVSVATAAMTAGVSLAVAALVLYVFNIGGVKDKTDAAVESSEKFLAIGWDSFTTKFKPVTDAINGAVDAFIHLIDVQKQFSAQPLPSLAPGPSGQPLQKTIEAESPFNVKGTAPIPQGLPGAGIVVDIKDINMMKDFMNAMQELKIRQSQISTGFKDAGANAKQFAQDIEDSKSATEKINEEMQKAIELTNQHVSAVQQANAAEKERQAAIADARTKMQEVVDITTKATQSSNDYATGLRNTIDATKQQAEFDKQFNDVIQGVDSALNKSNATFQAHAQILGSLVGTQKIFTDGANEEAISLQKAQEALISSQGALENLDKNLQSAQITAYNQGWVDFNTTLDQFNLTAANTQGVFDAFVASIDTQKGQISEMNKGFTDGEADVQKWAEGMLQAQSKSEGMTVAIDEILPKLGVQLPQGLNLSNEAAMKFAEAMTNVGDSVTQALQDADKTWQSALDDFNKAALAAPADQRKAWGEFQKAQQEAFKTLQEGLAGHSANQQKLWADYYQKIGQAQQKFATDSNKDWDAYFQNLAQKFGPFLNKQDVQFIGDFAQLQETTQQGLNAIQLKFEKLKIGDPASLQDFQQTWGQVMGTLVASMNKLPPAQRAALDPLVRRLVTMPINNIADAQRAMDSLGFALNSINNPATTFEQKSQQLEQHLQQISGLQPQQPIQQFGNAAQGATGGINNLSQGMRVAIDLNQGFTRGVSDAIGQLNILDDNASRAFAAFIPALQGLTVAFNQGFTVAISDAIGQLNILDSNAANAFAAFGPALQGLAVAFNQGFTVAVSDAIGQLNILNQNAANAFAAFMPALQGLAVAFNQGFSVAVSDAVGQLNILNQNAANAFAAFMPALQGLTVAFNQAFSIAVNDAIGQLDRLNQNAAVSFSGFYTVLQGLTVAFNQAFSIAVNDAIGQLNRLNSNATVSFSGFYTALQGLTVAFNGAFSKITSNATGQLNQLNSNAATLFSGFGTALQGLVQAFNGAFSQIQSTAQMSINSIISSLNSIPKTITVTVNVVQSGAVPKVAARGGTFGLGPTGFESIAAANGGTFQVSPVSRPYDKGTQHAASGGVYMVSKPTQIGNLTVGEGNKPELLIWKPGTGRFRGGGILTVIPFAKLGAASGGQFPVFGSAPGPGLFPGAGFTPTTNPNPTIINYGGIPAPKQTAGQGGPQQGMPSTVGAGTILVAPGGIAVTGPVTAPPGNPASGGGSLIPGAPGMSIPSTSIEKVTPYQMAKITGEAVASNIQAQQQDSQKEMDMLLSLLRKLLKAVSFRDHNTNLVVDGQKIASSIQKYLGSNAYGGM